MRRNALAARHLFALVVLLGVAPAALATEAASQVRTRSAAELIERMARAVQARDYTGVFVYLHGDEMEAMRIVHRASGGRESERLLSLNGTPREIIRDSAQVTCILPERKSASSHIARRFVRNPISALVPGDLRGIEEFYSLELAGKGRIAGRKAQRVRIRPLDRFRYGYEFWIDVETGLPLRMVLVGSDGEAVEQVMFTDLELPERIPDEWLEPTIDGEGFTWFREHLEPGSGTPESSNWRVADLPPGFRLALYEQRKLPGSDRLVAHRMYSDGLASVSVYVEQEEDETPDVSFTGGSRMGAVNAYGRMVDGYQTVVVGKVPLTTARHIARSIEHKTEASQ